MNGTSTALMDAGLLAQASQLTKVDLVNGKKVGVGRVFSERIGGIRMLVNCMFFVFLLYYCLVFCWLKKIIGVN